MVVYLQKNAIYENFQPNEEQFSESYVAKILDDYKENRRLESFDKIAQYLKKFPNYEANPIDSYSLFVSQMLYHHQKIIKCIDRLETSGDSVNIAYSFTQLLNIMKFEDKSIIVNIFDSLKELLTPNEIAIFLSNQPEEEEEENQGLIRFFLRCNQLMSVSYDDSGIEKIDNLLLSHFIERRIFRIQRNKNYYFKKKTRSRTMFYNSFRKVSYIFLKNHGNQTLRKLGVSKKVTAALLVPDDPAVMPRVVALAVNKTSSINKRSLSKLSESKIISMDENYEDIKNELHLHRKFSGNIGIWPLFGSFRYKKPSKEKEYVIPKICSVMPLATSPLLPFCRGPLITTMDELEDCFSIIKQLASGLHYLHTNKYIHGDLKPDNALFAYLPNGKIMAGLSDFGFTFKAKNGKPLPFPLDQGYYGTLFCTAPELFGNKAFNKDLFKAEIWALGYLFHMLFLKKEPHFGSIPSAQSNCMEDPVPGEKRIKMFDLIVEEIEKPREVLIKKENHSLLEDFTLLVYDMMRFDPSKRLNIQQVVARLESLEEKIVTASFNSLSIEEQAIVA